MTGEIHKAIIHQVGNKANGDGVRFSEEESNTVDVDIDIINMLDKSFQSENLHQFFFDPIIDLNPIYVFVRSIFNDPSKFISESQNIARYLYENSTHPKIKSGELWLLYLSNCQINEHVADAVCILKSENKQTVLQLKQQDNGYDIVKQEGFGLNKIDKGCIIYNIDNEFGYACSVVDSGAKKGDEAKFWIDDFLHVRPIQNAYHKTKVISEAIVNYVSTEMPKMFDISKSEQAIIINNSVKELRTQKEINIDDMKSKIFTDSSVKKDFDRYFDDFQVENGIVLNGNIEISRSAIKKTGYNSITTIKLDKNFDIRIHNGEKFIERGYDNDLNMSYYKLYFRQEK